LSSPLTGIKIVDLSRLAPGPYATMLLGDMGAEVVKIEEAGPPSGRRAQTGQGVPKFLERDERGHVFNVLNRNKKSIRLNLKSEAGHRIFFELVANADVVVEEFRPDVKKRLRIDYPEVSAANPRIVYCSLTGYGQDGPYRDIVGHDVNYLALAGLLGLIGTEEGGPVIPLNVIADYAGGGMHAALAIMFALFARERTGRGQYVDCAMHDGVVSLLAPFFADYFATGQVPRRGSTLLQGSAPFYQIYQCADGKWLSIASLEPWFFANLCRALGLEEFAGDQWSETRWPAMRDALSRTFAGRARDEWWEILREGDVAVGKVYELDEAAADPHLRARKMFVELPHPTFGPIRQVGISMKLSDTPGEIRSNPPTPGQHTDEILRDLGYAVTDIAALRNEGAVG
jgi:crotonobetainyl-CoA:carnitine CoA-transferase CaiB-like acyl-CoA transferase